ncbi:MAG: hypothetical protein HY600_05320 [Candidatus Omnitrophica bacterium]|nr:hypothetical protein [Candidatus Omnitrophota bacterium]
MPRRPHEPPRLEQFLATGRPDPEAIHGPAIPLIIGAAIGAAVGAGVGAVVTGITVATAAVVGALIGGTLGAFLGGGLQPPSVDVPTFGGEGETAESPRYSFGPLDNTVSNEIPLPAIYGTVRYGGNIIWQTDPGETIKQIVAIGEGEIESITSVRFNDQDPATLSGVSYAVYTGTAAQGVDARAPATGPNSVPSLRYVAYIASTLTASEKLQGKAVMTADVKGLKVETWTGTAWTTTRSWSDNPAACLRDYLLAKRYGVGLDASLLDHASFGAAYDHCNGLVDNGVGGTHKRYQLDLAIDSRRPHLDILRDMLLACNGYFVFSGGKIKLRLLGLNETTQHAFMEDTIVKDSLTYRLAPQDERPNKVVVRYVDPAQNWAKIDVIVNDAIDQSLREALLLENVVPLETQAIGVTRQPQALRLATLLLNQSRFEGILATWQGGHDTIHLEVGDIVTLTHSTPGWTAKPFRIMQISDDQIGERTFVAREFNSSLYNDQVDTGIQNFSYGTPTSPFDVPASVSGLTLTEDGLLQKDGVFVDRILAQWTEPPDPAFVRGYEISWSEDGGASKVQTSVERGTSKVLLPGAKVGSAYVVKVVTISAAGMRSAGVTAAITTVGKNTFPSDVTGFAVAFANDHIHFSWIEPPDADIWGYEIREGSSWNVGVVIATKIATTSYDLFAFSAGTKTYWIKAIDTAGNYSQTAASASLTITAVPAANVVLTYNEFAEGAGGALSGEAMVKYTTSYSSAYYRQALGLRSATRWATKTGTWAQAQSAGDKLNTPIASLAGAYLSRVIDIGAVMNIQVTVNLKVANVAGGSLLIEIRTSNDNMAWSAYQNFSPGQYSGRYFQFRLTFSTTNSSYDVEIYDFEAVFDADDLIQSGAGVSVPAGGATVAFPVAFNASPGLIAIVVASVGSSLIPEIVSGSKTKTSFQVKLKDPSTLTYVTGTVDWYAKGY